MQNDESLTAAAAAAAATRGDKLRQIEAVTDAALAHLEPEDLLTELMERTRELLQVDTAAVYLIDPATRELVTTASMGMDESVRPGFRLPSGAGFGWQVASSRAPVMIEKVGRDEVVNPAILKKGVRSLLAVPMVIAGEVIGVLHVGTVHTRHFTENEVALLQLVAERAAMASQARRSEIERVTATVLQRSLLPERLPVLPGLEMAARYIPTEDGGVGGDWYDVFCLPSGQLGVVMGDVVGHSLHAAIVMGRLRSALRAYALESDDPATVLEMLDRKALHFEPGMMATLTYAVIEPRLDRLHISLAGHPQPVLAMPDRPAVFAELPVDPPVGVQWGLRRQTSVLELPVGMLMLFYTDGLVERRYRSIEEGLARLLRVVTPGPVDLVCQAVMSTLVSGERPRDDIAALAARHRGIGTMASP